jgi:hypothetical protein
MSQNDGEDIVQLLIDTGVLTPEIAAQIKSIQADVIMQHMRAHDVLIPAEEPRVRGVLTTLMGGGSLTDRVQAKIELVGIITDNVHRRIERQGVRNREQRERITGEAFPMVARLARQK